MSELKNKIVVDREKLELLLSKIRGCNESQCVLTHRLSKCGNLETHKDCIHFLDFEGFLEGLLK